MLPCMKMAVRSVSQTGTGVSLRPGNVTSITCPWPPGTGISRTDGSVMTSRPERISAGTWT